MNIPIAKVAAAALGLSTMIAFSLILDTGSSSAATHDTRSTVGHSTVAKPHDFTACTVGANDVKYRSGPGTNYTAYGEVNIGQEFDVSTAAQGNNPADGKLWDFGNLPGIRNNVWIRQDLIEQCFI